METTEGIHSMQIVTRENKLKLGRFYVNEELKYATKECFKTDFASSGDEHVDF